MQRIIFHFVILIVYFHFHAIVCGQSTIEENRFAAAEKLMERAVESSTVPSISVAISMKGEIIWEKAYGYANVEKKIKATPETQYSLASVSKPITATGIMTLVGKGSINLEEPVNSYLGDAKVYSYSHDTNEATVRKLMNHTAGLATHWHFFYSGDQYSRPSMDETIRRYGIIFTPPGQKYMYSNLGYGILDYIIEQVSGISYPQFMNDEVFKPLGMLNSAVYTEPGSDDKVAQRYQGREKLIPFYDFDHRGASAVYCSAHDLLKFGMFHLKNHMPDQRPILSDKSIDQMKMLYDTEVEVNEYSLGWSLSYLGKYRAVSHGGSMPGVRTNLLLLPELDIVLVMLTNSNYGGLRKIGQAILEVLIPNLKEDMAVMQKSTQELKPNKTEIPESLIGIWKGEIVTYAGKIPVELVIKAEHQITFKISESEHGGEKSVKAFGQIVVEEDIINVSFLANIPFGDAARFSHRINLILFPKGNQLEGCASAYAINIRFGLPHYVSFERVIN